MENFDIVKYLRENHLGPHSILGGYVDLHALKEDLSSDQADISRLIRQITAKVKYPYLGDKNAQELSQTLSNTKTKDQLEKILDDLNNPKPTSSSDEIDIDDERHPNFDPYRQGSYFENKNEADYGNNEPVDEVPYVGAQKKLDGFGDEFDQVAPVEEIQMAGENPWLNDSIDGEMIGDWTAYFAGQMGTIYLVHPLLKDLTVYATPGWEGEEGIAIAVVEDDVDRPWKNGIVPGSTNSYETFVEYAADMQTVR